MKLTERIQLRKTELLSKMCYAANNLYNLANYYVRQEFFYFNDWLRYDDLWHALKDKDAHKALPSQTSQQVLKLVDKNWKSFFKALKEYKERPGRFSGRPRPPKYKEKRGEFVVAFSNQQCRIKAGFVHFPRRTRLPPVKNRLKEGLRQVRIVPRDYYYVFKIIYERNETSLHLDEKRIVGIDLGLNNVATVVNNAGFRPAVIKGGAIKSINQFYNKQRAKLASVKDKQGIGFETRRLQRLVRKQNNKIHDAFHKISRTIVNYCAKHDFGTIVNEYNVTWKQGIKMGRKNNQNFFQVPFLKLVNQIVYKAELVGIRVVKVNEAYTSKYSFLDGEPIARRSRYLGSRVSRGLFKTNKGALINADVNAGYNIVKKAFPNAILADGIEGLGLIQYSITVS
ncbi:MAG: RNA-guided endonuclease InsQ/TnpB family protein [Promethearchaeota archaeon]